MDNYSTYNYHNRRTTVLDFGIKCCIESYDYWCNGQYNPTDYQRVIERDLRSRTRTPRCQFVEGEGHLGDRGDDPGEPPVAGLVPPAEEGLDQVGHHHGHHGDPRVQAGEPGHHTAVLTRERVDQRPVGCLRRSMSMKSRASWATKPQVAGRSRRK